MQIYKDTFALEACPAKTAETVSYGATFAVLGWLLLSNYSGSDYAGQPIVSATSPSENSITQTESIISRAAAYVEVEVEVEALTETPFSAAILNQPEAESSDFVTTPPSWYADLPPYQQHEGQSHQRAFSTVDWSVHTSDSGQHITGFNQALMLVLPLPLIDTAYLFDTKSASEMASNTSGEAGLVREIMVNGAEADRLTNRPASIHRPQIPRPYRAQEIQRSFVLPPRIQALRP
jgi:hypothetical protein